MPVSPGTDLHEQLTRWVAEGLIDTGQAARIEAAEAARAQPQPAPARAARRAPLVVEALGYLGGALAMVAGFIAVTMLWPDISTTAELAFAAAGAIAFGLAAALVVTGEEPAFGRLRSVLWLLSTACLAAFMGVLAAQVWDLSPIGSTLTTAAVATVYAAVLWWRTRTPLQHLAAFAGAAVLAGAGIASIWPGTHVWGPGLGVWTLSAAWGAAAYRGYLAPREAGYLAAGVGLLTGAQMTMDAAAGHVLALATVAGLFAAGVALRRVWVLALGAVGVIQVVPQTAARYLPQQVAAPLAVFSVGLVLLAVALWLAKTRRTPKSR